MITLCYQAKFSFSEEELKPYFSLPNVLTGLFQLTEQLFGVKVVPAKTDTVDTWHEHVMVTKLGLFRVIRIIHTYNYITYNRTPKSNSNSF